jgi:hypothetical protein
MVPSTIQCLIAYNKKNWHIHIIHHNNASCENAYIIHIDSFSVVNSYLKLGWVNLVNKHWTLIFLWQQCYMPSWNCHVNTPKIHHLNYPMSLEQRTHINSHNRSNLQIALHAPRNGPAWFAKMVFLKLHNEDHFLTRVSRKELIML